MDLFISPLLALSVFGSQFQISARETHLCAKKEKPLSLGGWMQLMPECTILRAGVDWVYMCSVRSERLHAMAQSFAIFLHPWIQPSCSHHTPGLGHPMSQSFPLLFKEGRSH